MTETGGRRVETIRINHLGGKYSFIWTSRCWEMRLFMKSELWSTDVQKTVKHCRAVRWKQSNYQLKEEFFECNSDGSDPVINWGLQSVQHKQQETLSLCSSLSWPWCRSTVTWHHLRTSRVRLQDFKLHKTSSRWCETHTALSSPD